MFNKKENINTMLLHLYKVQEEFSSTLFRNTYIISSKTTKENPWTVNTRSSIAATSVEEGGAYIQGETERKLHVIKWVMSISYFFIFCLCVCVCVFAI